MVAPARTAPTGASSLTASALSDTPLADVRTDRLERRNFALRLARTLAERTGDRGYVVGLYGQWGEGKSTVLNFVRQELASYPTEQMRVVEFNPWFDSDETHLYAEFLHAVAAAVGVDLERKYEKAIRRASRAQGFAESVGLPNSVNSIVKVSTLLGAVGGLGQPTLRDFHDRLREVLAAEGAAARRVVVLMDDIDRLDNAQISAVFRMVKLAADFPNLGFLLAFDQDVVAEALGAHYRSRGVGGGREFLEKIVNAPLQLPRADPSAVAQVLREMLDQVLATHQVLLNEPGERIRLDDALEAGVWPCVTSLRQGKRLLGKADFALPVMAGEVNPVDQVLMEALQLLFPELYSFAANHKSLLVRALVAEQEQTSLREKLEDACQGLRPEGLELLQRLFPRLQTLDRNRQFTDAEQEQWTHARRVCSPSHFDRYFAYGLPVGDILDSEITAVIQAVAPDNTALLHDLLDAHDPGLVIRKLAENSVQIPADAAMRLARAVAVTLANTTTDVAFQASRMIRRLLETVGPTTRTEAAQELLHAASVQLAAAVFTWLEAPHHDPEHGQPLLGQEHTQQLGQRLTQRLLALPADQLIIPGGQSDLMAYAVCLRHQPERAQQYLVTALQADAVLLQHVLALHLGGHRVPFVSALTRTGYQRLTEILSAEEWLVLIRHHFPTAEATFGSLPRSAAGQAELPAGSPEYAVLAFLAAYQAIDTHEPPTPATVFEPTAEEPGQFRNYSPHHLAQQAGDTVPFVMRSAVVLPRQLDNRPGRPISSDSDRTRINVLTRVADQAGLRQALTALIGTPPWEMSTIPDWTTEGGSGREAAKLLCATSDDTAPGFSLALQMEIGRATPYGGLSEEPGITATLDLVLRLPKDQRRLTLVELRDLLIDALELHRAVKGAATSLLPGQPQTGEGVLCMSSPAELGQLIDMEAYGASSRTSRNEIPLHYRLPLHAPQELPLRFGTSAPSPEAELAIEMIKRGLQWTGRQDYAPALNQLLRTAPR
ncbi:P-loop NTPase fold protein [Streptomyces sp. NPDC059445]|uniref:P-loop NTPase fold protein n=1 Tax=Streptomyces sp. NPDC059445 TaxID=3346832 RepID=UPI0036A0DC07